MFSPNEWMSSCQKAGRKKITAHIKNLLPFQNVALFSFPSSINTETSLFSAARLRTSNEAGHITMPLLRSVFHPHKQSSLSSSPWLPRSHVLPSRQSRSLWFSSSVWHIHQRVSIHQSCLTLTTPQTGRQPGNIKQAAGCQGPSGPPHHRQAHQTGSRPCWWEEIH